MTTRTAPTPTRTTPLPVRIDTAPGQILLYIGDVKVASAWGPVVDDPDTWIYWNGSCDPYRIGGGRDGAQALIDHLCTEWINHETSLWHPDHGDLDASWRVAAAPPGVVCVGCGDNQGGRSNVTVVAYQRDGQTTCHYVCDNCETYLDDEEGGQ